MKINHERYKDVNAENYEKPTLVSILIGKEGDTKIGNLINEIKNSKILEFGCGTGRFTRLYYKENQVTCVDINTHLFTLKEVPILKADVTKLEGAINTEERFDYILSFWMTEYLDETDLAKTLSSCKKFLDVHGKIIFTFVSKGLWGRLYIAGAKLKGIKKFNYNNDQIKKISTEAGLNQIETITIKRFGFEFGKIIVFN